MSSPPSRFWPGDLTPLRASHVAPDAVWRSSSYPAGRRTSPSDTARAASFKAARKAEYRYEHSPPSAGILCC